MSNEVTILLLQVPIFCIESEKEGAERPLLEASEALEAWKQWQAFDSNNRDVLYPLKDEMRDHLADEIFDTIQASVNFAARNGLSLQEAAKRVTARNIERGRADAAASIYAGAFPVDEIRREFADRCEDLVVEVAQRREDGGEAL